MILFFTEDSRTTEVATSMNSKPTQTAATKTEPVYWLGTCAPDDLSNAELTSCVEIVRDGGAVAISLEKLRKAKMLAFASKSGVIVGVGSIKRDRPGRAADVAHKSGFSFPRETPELGYVAIAPQHRRRGLSHKIVDALVNATPGSLFATTDDEHMMRTLSGAGFVRRGHKWPGHRGQLSLWLKESEKRS
jgi:hypothetical protein